MLVIVSIDGGIVIVAEGKLSSHCDELNENATSYVGFDK